MNLLILCPPHSKMSASFLLHPSASPREEVISDHQQTPQNILNRMLPDAFDNTSFYFWESSCSI